MVESRAVFKNHTTICWVWGWWISKTKSKMFGPMFPKSKTKEKVVRILKTTQLDGSRVSHPGVLWNLPSYSTILHPRHPSSHISQILSSTGESLPSWDFHLWAQPAHEAGQGEHILQPWTIALSHFLAGFHFVSSTPSLNHFKNKTIFKLQSFCLEEAVFGALRL